VGISVAPSETLEAAIAGVLAEGVGTGERLGELGRLGARLILQRAVEEEVAAFLRGPGTSGPAARGSRNGVRPPRFQTAEGS